MEAKIESTHSLTQVTVMGLGPMGRAIAKSFLDNGYQVTVWNRTAGKADELREKGAVIADSAANAVAASRLVVICVLNYEAVYSILEQARDVMNDKIVVNLTGGSPEEARELAKWGSHLGIHYLDGAIIVPAFGQPEGVILYSGSEDSFQIHRETLARLSGTAQFLDRDPGRAAAFDVALLDLFWTSMSGYIHAVALAQSENIAANDLVPYAQKIAGMLPEIMAEFANQVDNNHYPGKASNIYSTAAVLENIIRTSKASGIDTGMIAAAKALVDQALEQGFGSNDFSRLTSVIRHSRYSS